MLDGMSSVYALPCFANTVKGPMKRGASKLAPKSDTACLARFCVANKTNEPTLNSLEFPLPLFNCGDDGIMNSLYPLCVQLLSIDRSCNGVLDKPYDGLSALDKVHSLRAEPVVQLGILVHYRPGLSVLFVVA
ncbi:unnamed protein product [Phytophthora fragariaefolia]|uniref:Unnamed protein product n=1 Tax=Phytophthora fragariaefolia TaxID=1490495 RepID=A0A9W6YHV0_9STRA|nr:unnamed protein product [Phytophthora fragariaefolia]